jgi:hypothetical protein
MMKAQNAGRQRELRFQAKSSYEWRAHRFAAAQSSRAAFLWLARIAKDS